MTAAPQPQQGLRNAWLRNASGIWVARDLPCAKVAKRAQEPIATLYLAGILGQYAGPALLPRDSAHKLPFFSPFIDGTAVVASEISQFSVVGRTAAVAPP